MKMQAQHLNLYYGTHQALFDVSLEVPENKVVALIGPSGCGKSTFLRTLNRMNDLIDGVQIDGNITLDDRDFTTRMWISSICASAWVWSSSAQTHFRCPFTTTSPMAAACTD